MALQSSWQSVRKTWVRKAKAREKLSPFGEEVALDYGATCT